MKKLEFQLNTTQKKKEKKNSAKRKINKKLFKMQ